MVGWLVVGFKADCLTRDLGLGGMPSVEVFLSDPSPYLPEFRRKKTENSERLGRQTGLETEPGTSRLPVLNATTPPLVRRLGIGRKLFNLMF